MALPSRLSVAGAVLFLMLGAGSASAAHQVPPELLHATESEQVTYIQESGQLSLGDKLRAGRQRFAERRNLRQQLVNGVWANAESGSRYRETQPAIAASSIGEKGDRTWLPWTLLAVSTAAWFLLKWYKTGRITLQMRQT